MRMCDDGMMRGDDRAWVWDVGWVSSRGCVGGVGVGVGVVVWDWLLSARSVNELDMTAMLKGR